MTNDKDSELTPSTDDVGTVGTGDYAVGHCRPPRSKQFKPGVSGNPRGRPKRNRNFNRMFHFALEEKLPANGTGKQQTAYFAFVQSLVRSNPATEAQRASLTHAYLEEEECI